MQQQNQRRPVISDYNNNEDDGGPYNTPDYTPQDEKPTMSKVVQTLEKYVQQ